MVAAGAAIVPACGSGGDANTGQTGNNPGAGGSGGQAGSAAGVGGAAAGSAGLGGKAGGVPMGTYPSCAAGSSAGVGLCCTYVSCYTPPSGEGCAPPETAPICHGVGSGSCDCGPVQGPFAGPYGDPSVFTASPGCAMGKSLEDGACCYLTSIEGCEGRPLYVEGAIRVAGVGVGAGWC